MQHGRERAAEKAAWRERFHAVRSALSAAERTAASAGIVRRVEALVAEARTVHLFWPLVARGEVDVRPLVSALLGRGVAVGLPVVASRLPPGLLHRRIVAESDLVPGAWGLLEPRASCPEMDPAAFEVVVVPALGLGRDGTRIGYGGGYYDAFLADMPALRVGVVWAACLVDHLPAEPFDARLDVVMTENETVWTGRTQRGAGAP